MLYSSPCWQWPRVCERHLGVLDAVLTYNDRFYRIGCVDVVQTHLCFQSKEPYPGTVQWTGHLAIKRLVPRLRPGVRRLRHHLCGIWQDQHKPGPPDGRRLGTEHDLLVHTSPNRSTSRPAGSTRSIDRRIRVQVKSALGAYKQRPFVGQDYHSSERLGISVSGWPCRDAIGSVILHGG